VSKLLWLVPVILIVTAAGGRISGSGERMIYSVSGSSILGASAASAAEGLDKMAVLTGTWKTDSQQFDTDFSKAGRDTSTLRNDCWRSGEFYACDQYVNGKSKALIVFSFSASDGTYNTYAIRSGGAPASSGKLKIDGDTWTYQNPQDADSQSPYFRTVNVFEDDSKIHFSVEFTRDNQHWVTMNEGVETRQK
jgi:hypothetical protein